MPEIRQSRPKPPVSHGVLWTHDKNRGGQWWGKTRGTITNMLPDYILAGLPPTHPLRVEIEAQGMETRG